MQSLKDKTILIVENCDSCFFLMKEILGDSDVTILRVSNGEDAVMLCTRNRQIDLVVMDIIIPGIDGINATQLIKEQRKDLKIIAVSAATSEYIKNSCYAAGCEKFIPKPIDIESFMATICSMLKG